MKFEIQKVEINCICCFVQLADGRWMGLGDLLAETLGKQAELGQYDAKFLVDIEKV